MVTSSMMVNAYAVWVVRVTSILYRVECMCHLLVLFSLHQSRLFLEVGFDIWMVGALSAVVRIEEVVGHIWRILQEAVISRTLFEVAQCSRI